MKFIEFFVQNIIIRACLNWKWWNIFEILMHDFLKQTLTWYRENRGDFCLLPAKLCRFASIYQKPNVDHKSLREDMHGNRKQAPTKAI